MIHDRSIICFGGEDWWYHHPHHSEHILRRFARAGNKIIFINSISMGLPALAHADLLPRVLRKLRSYAKLARTTEEGITVFSPATIPFYGTPLARSVNRRLLHAQVSLLARSRGLRRPVLWIAIPTAVEMIGRLNESLVVYLVSDKYDANTMDHATDPTAIRHLHEQALRRADIILYSGCRLFDEATTGKERSYRLEHGIDHEHFASVEHAEVASEVKRIPRPRLGYFGAIEPWLIDQELVRRIAMARPDWHWVFIGNLARGMTLDDLPNVHLLPPVPYSELPHYAAGFDVCVLPWSKRKTWVEYAAPMKVREYLATGKPTVITRLDEFEPLGDVLRMADSSDEFLEHLQSALGEQDSDARRKRQAAVAGGTWDARAEWVSDLIDRELQRKAESRSLG